AAPSAARAPSSLGGGRAENLDAGLEQKLSWITGASGAGGNGTAALGPDPAGPAGRGCQPEVPQAGLLPQRERAEPPGCGRGLRRGVPGGGECPLPAGCQAAAGAAGGHGPGPGQQEVHAAH
ncbi:hypothetical protein H8959_007105, partial [Pygathrix nigripes]